MKKRILNQLSFLIVTASMLAAMSAFGQDPYLMDGLNNGIGQYGYIEAESQTFNRINSNTHSNIYQLAARWWAENTEFIYYSGVIADCSSSQNIQASTFDFKHNDFPNWGKGEYAYVSIYAEYCGSPNTWSHTNGMGGVVGYNERKFLKVDVDNLYSGTMSPYVVDNPTGSQNLVGTFTIDAGTYTTDFSKTLSLDSLWIWNGGTAIEGTDIPNDGISIFYEPVTGSEVFDGTEASKLLFGDYAGDNMSNNRFGHNDLDIAIPVSGLRVYIVVNDLKVGYDPSKAVLFWIENDGIGFKEPQDNHSAMRIESMEISGGNLIPLPIQLHTLQAQLTDNATHLRWQTLSEINFDYFEIQKSIDGEYFNTIGYEKGRGSENTKTSYHFIDESPNEGTNYYRLKQIDLDGTFDYSKTVSVEKKAVIDFTLYPNPVKNNFYIKIPNEYIDNSLNIHIFDVTGQEFFVKYPIQTFENNLLLLQLNYMPSGIYFIQITDENTGSSLYANKFLKL